MSNFSQLYEPTMRELRRFQFNKRERLLVELILDKSFRLGRDRARFPKLDYFTFLTGISRGNVSMSLGSLQAKGVVDALTEQCYAVNPETKFWEVEAYFHWTPEIEQLDAWLDQLSPGEGVLLPEPPGISDALRQLAADSVPTQGALRSLHPNRPIAQDAARSQDGVVSRELARRESGAREQGGVERTTPPILAGPGKGATPFPARSAEDWPARMREAVEKGVPESGTERSQIGNTAGSAKLLPAGKSGESGQIQAKSDSVPDSGTLLYKTCKLLSLKVPEGTSNLEAFKGVVPESGTDEESLMARCHALLGLTVMAKNGGRWRNLAREEADLLDVALDRLRLRLDNPKPVHDRGAWTFSEIKRLRILKGGKRV